MTTRATIKIDGIVPIIPTPFDYKERIDWSAFGRLLDFACGIDVCAVCLPAYASEFYKLSDAERRQLVAKAVEHVDNRLPVIAQANAGSAIQAAEMARFAQRCRRGGGVGRRAPSVCRGRGGHAALFRPHPLGH